MTFTPIAPTDPGCPPDCGGPRLHLCKSPTYPVSPEAAALRKFRGTTGLTLARAAEVLGCSVTDTCSLETGRCEPASPFTWKDVANLYRSAAGAKVTL